MAPAFRPNPAQQLEVPARDDTICCMGIEREHGQIIADLEADADRLKGLSLRDLGYVPHPRELSTDGLAELDSETLEWMARFPEEERLLSHRRARLLAGAIWQASRLLVDELFQDVISLYDKETITGADINETQILWDLPPQYVTRYNGLFARRFLIVAADLTRKITEDWDYPSCVAQELAVRCLLGRIELIADTYELDLDPDWRTTLETRLLEDTDSDMLYDRQLDGFQHDDAFNERFRLAPMAFEHWFEPFDDRRPGTPYAS